jgi:hypothetical protein
MPIMCDFLIKASACRYTSEILQALNNGNKRGGRCNQNDFFVLFE